VILYVRCWGNSKGGIRAALFYFRPGNSRQLVKWPVLFTPLNGGIASVLRKM
jgi:hypothetical protein